MMYKKEIRLLQKASSMLGTSVHGAAREALYFGNKPPTVFQCEHAECY